MLGGGGGSASSEGDANSGDGVSSGGDVSSGAGSGGGSASSGAGHVGGGAAIQSGLLHVSPAGCSHSCGGDDGNTGGHGGFAGDESAVAPVQTGAGSPAKLTTQEALASGALSFSVWHSWSPERQRLAVEESRKAAVKSAAAETGQGAGSRVAALGQAFTGVTNPAAKEEANAFLADLGCERSSPPHSHLADCSFICFKICIHKVNPNGDTLMYFDFLLHSWHKAIC